MRKSLSKIRMKFDIPWLVIIAIAFSVMCLTVIVFGLKGYFMLDARVRTLEDQASTSATSELQLAIEFYREQIQTLIWLLSVIIGGGGAILTFIGINTHKSIEDKFNIYHNKLVAAKDIEILDKKIFILYKNDREDILKFYKELHVRGYDVKMIKASIVDVFHKIEGASIVIYYVDNSSDPKYQDISTWCEDNKVHCILFCPEIDLTSKFMKKLLFYTSTSKQITKLRESLYALLYLAP